MSCSAPSERQGRRPNSGRVQRWSSHHAGLRRLSLILMVLTLLQPAPTMAVAHSPTVVYVAIGDSLTLGFGADHPLTENYPALLARHLPTGSAHHNVAIAGITIADAVEQELPAAIAVHPTLVTIWLGYNDIIVTTAPAAFSKSLAKLLGALRQQHARIFVANMPNPRIVPITALNPDDHLARAYNALIAAVAARYGATVVDIYANTRALWGKAALVSDDDVHPTSKGHAELAQIFFHVMHAHGAL